MIKPFKLFLLKKSKSVVQQRLFGMAYAYKKGELDLDSISSDYRDDVKQLANSLSLKKLKEFAKTKHKDLPYKLD